MASAGQNNPADLSEYSDLDLNIRNYTLQELLDLLQLPPSFTRQDLRRAMRLVANLHPDKSGAPQAVYQLFYQAHLLCRQLLAARAPGSESALVREDYDTPEGAAISAEMGKRKDFQEWFNKSFEEFHTTLHQQSEGYDGWLQEEIVEEPRVRSHAQMAAAMARRRKEAAKKAIMLADGPVAAEMGGGTMLVAGEEVPLGLAGGSVGDIAYGDLKQSYEESVVPVAAVDAGVGREYSTLEELMAARAGLDAATATYWGSSERALESEQRRQEAQASADARMYALHQEHQKQLDEHARWQAATLALTGAPGGVVGGGPMPGVRPGPGSRN
jgi:hypothetical protein